MNTKNIQLGRAEALLLFTLEKLDKTVFSVGDAKGILENTNNQVVHNLLSRLVRKGRLKRVEKGRYMLVPARAGIEGLWSINNLELLKSFSFDYYVSFWSGLSYWGLTEQIVNSVSVCILGRKKSLKYNNVNYKFVNFSKKHFFGFVNRNGINVASKEKLILDCLHCLKYSGGIAETAKALNNIKTEVNWEKLLQYLNKFGDSAVERRLFFLLDYLKIKDNIVHKALSDKKFAGYRLLDPSGKKDGHYSYKYGLKINISPESLVEEIL